MRFGPSRKLTAGTGGKIVELLQHGPRTIDDLASTLGLTRTAVRAQLSVLASDGVVEQMGMRKGRSKPARLFGVTAAAEQLMSRAYVPVLVQMLHVLSEQTNPAEFDQVMRETGRRLAPGRRGGTLRERVDRANQLLRNLGAVTSVTGNEARFVIRSHSCPLAAATREFPQACIIVTSLLTEIVGQPVSNCCERSNPQQCCFEITLGAA